MIRDKIVWGIVIIWFAIMIVLFLAAGSKGEMIGLEWDVVEDVDGYYIYQSTAGNDYDYDSPVTFSKYPDGKIPADRTSVQIDLPGVANDDLRYKFVARAFRADEVSENSNEVSYLVSLVPPLSASELTGSYEKDEGLIKLSWSQTPDSIEGREISHWIIYYRIGETDWAPIGRINSDHELNLQAPFSAVPEGSRADVDFVIVTYRRSGVYSSNSDILTITVDRQGVPPIQNLRINIEIPVQ